MPVGQAIARKGRRELNKEDKLRRIKGPEERLVPDDRERIAEAYPGLVKGCFNLAGAIAPFSAQAGLLD